MPPVKRKVASASKDTKKLREDTHVSDRFSVSDEVDKLLDGLIKVKEEEVDYSDKIKEKIFEDMDEEDLFRPEINVNHKKLLSVDNVMDKLESSDREDFLSIIDNYVKDVLQENIERISKLVYETIWEKDKLIENLTNEKDTMNEKYRKYKRMAENARNTIKELEEKNKDIKSKADLREEMLTEERTKNQQLTEKATKTKLILETLAARGDKEGSGMGPLLKLLNGGKKAQGENSKPNSEILKSSVNSSTSTESTNSSGNTTSISNNIGNTNIIVNSKSTKNTPIIENIISNIGTEKTTSIMNTTRGINSNITRNTTTTTSSIVGNKSTENTAKILQTTNFTLKEASLMVKKKPSLNKKNVKNLNESILMKNSEVRADQELDLKKTPSVQKTPANSDLKKFPGLVMTPSNKNTAQGLTKDMKLDLDRKKEDSTVAGKDGGNTTNTDLEKYTDLMKKINQQLSNTRKNML